MGLIMQALSTNILLEHAVICEPDYTPFNPRMYLQEYYTNLGTENIELLDFFDRAYSYIFSTIKRAGILEFGGGPTIYQLISASKYPVSIDFSDYLSVNLQELTAWLHNSPEQFPWDTFIGHVIAREGAHCTPALIRRRARLIRRKVKHLLHCDARLPDPLGAEYRARYEIVSANFVLEAITQEISDWGELIDHVLPLVKHNGYLIICTVVGASSYRVGELYYPATPITPEIAMAKLRQRNFSIVMTHSIDAEHQERQGYQGIFMIVAQNRMIVAQNGATLH
jgi:nicotinamide N-methyltransferase